MAPEPTEDFLLIVWLVLSFVVLGGALAWVMLRNRRIEKQRDRVEGRRPGQSDSRS
jgi:hypothetical protein